MSGTSLLSEEVEEIDYHCPRCDLFRDPEILKDDGSEVVDETALCDYCKEEIRNGSN